MQNCEPNQSENQKPFDMSKMTEALRAYEEAKAALFAQFCKTPPVLKQAA